jgi:hypothetical protein
MSRISESRSSLPHKAELHMNKKADGNFFCPADSLCLVYHEAKARTKTCASPDRRFSKSRKIVVGHVGGHSLLHRPF